MIKVLQQLGVVDSNTRVAGISSGALTASALCSGMDERFLFKTVGPGAEGWLRGSGGPKNGLARGLRGRRAAPLALSHPHRPDLVTPAPLSPRAAGLRLHGYLPEEGLRRAHG